ncbi:putative DNA-binding protein [Actinacidiphila reveromycinica]|uniref:Putative DNA-binding protein n=1 Tax=Actinacidiphila reveromycinica TaxID=659352 RepID=A0A7U3UR65_9ACTN|nr:helix-turn-helix transcriptional regulator [Streptomyces sp. SN-593]BBA97226.1 putative DNA-binding protein [Streptomyces sp. SN-593]
MDREQLADFLRTRREALQPEDVGLPRGQRRRTAGLRREEVAALCGMSADYYGRIEQARGPQPSEQMLAAIARGLHLSLDERDHLFRMAGHGTPRRGLRTDHVSPGMMRVVDRLADTPAQVMSVLGETLLQTQPSMALVGDQTGYTGLDRFLVHRWFTDPASRLVYPEPDHPRHGRYFTAGLRAAYTALGPGSPAGELVDALLASSREFAAIWSAHEVGLHRVDVKRMLHPDVGLLELHCQTLLDEDQAQRLLVYTATPGSESYDKLQLLSSLGVRRPGT